MLVVLVAIEDPLLRATVLDMSHALGATVVPTANGTQALEILGAFRFDVLVVCEHAAIDVVKLSRLAKAAYPALRIVQVSGTPEDVDHPHVDAHLAMPFSIETLSGYLGNGRFTGIQKE